MSSGIRGAGHRDSSIYSHQVSDNLEIGNQGVSIGDLLGYSSEVEHQLQLENQSSFIITSLLNELENDDAYLELRDSLENQNVNMIDPKFVSSNEGDVMMKELIYPTTSEVHDDVFSYEENDAVVNEELLDPLSPPIATFTDHPKPRLLWNPKLHTCFLSAVKRLGGSKKATPKYIHNLMKIPGVTQQHVKSHLQKYRQGKHSVRNWIEISKVGSRDRKDPSNSLTSSDFSAPKPQNISLNCSAFTKNKQFKGKGKAHREKGNLYIKMQGEMSIKRFQAAQRYYLDLAMQNACRKIALYNLESALIESGNYLGQVTNLGTMAQMPTFHNEQLNTYTSHNSMEAVRAYTSIQQQQNSFEAPNVAYSQNGFASLQQGFFDTPGKTSEIIETLTYDPSEIYLNYDDVAATTILDDNYYGNGGGASNL